MSPASWHPYVLDDDEFRILQFADLDIQSKMRKSAPDELVLSYTQAMAAFMLFVEAPKDVLIAGLGGGSLSKFCYRHLPAARITTVEISAEVIDLRKEFLIPPDDARFRVVHADMAQWLPGRRAVADVILLDGYDHEGIPESLADARFYAQCADALTDNGVLVANINLGALADSTAARRLIEKAVGTSIAIRSAAGHNDILFGFRRADMAEVLAPARVKALKARARALRDETWVDFPLLLDKLRGSAAAVQVVADVSQGKPPTA